MPDRWYANVNDLVGGWIVANVDESMANINMDFDPETGVRKAVVIAETSTEADALRIADLLNYSEDPTARGRALLFGLVGQWTELWHTSASFHAYVQVLALMLPKLIEQMALVCGAEQEAMAEAIAKAARGEDS